MDTDQGLFPGLRLTIMIANNLVLFCLDSFEVAFYA